MSIHMTNWRVWLYRIVVIVVCGLMLVSFLMPWWTTRISTMAGDAVRIYGYGLRHNLSQLNRYISSDETPFYQTVLAWIYMVTSMGLIVFSLRLKDRAGIWLMVATGLIYIIYALIAVYVVINNRLDELGLLLQGWSSTTSEGIVITFFSSLRFGLYLAYIAGALCIILAMLRGIIVGKREVP